MQCYAVSTAFYQAHVQRPLQDALEMTATQRQGLISLRKRFWQRLHSGKGVCQSVCASLHQVSAPLSGDSRAGTCPDI